MENGVPTVCLWPCGIYVVIAVIVTRQFLLKCMAPHGKDQHVTYHWSVKSDLIVVCVALLAWWFCQAHTRLDSCSCQRGGGGMA